MTYKCPKGHDSTDSDYCSECGALIGQSKLSTIEPSEGLDLSKLTGEGNESGEICPDCGTLRVGNARFCEVCRHDFQNNKTGVAEAIVASQKAEKQPEIPVDNAPKSAEPAVQPEAASQAQPQVQPQVKTTIDTSNAAKMDFIVPEKLNIIISVDQVKASNCDIETAIKPDTKERLFPLDLEENLVGRRSASKGIYPEIEINDPGVSHRHLKFIRQQDGSFAVLELGSANGTELNGKPLEPGINTSVKAGDELAIGIWTQLKIVGR